MRFFLEGNAPLFAHRIVRHVDTQTDIVAAWLVIQGTDATQVNFYFKQKLHK